MADLSVLKNTIEGFDRLKKQYDDLKALIEMVDEENDPSLVPDVVSELEDFTANFEELRMST